jgi:hypothetical protein
MTILKSLEAIGDWELKINEQRTTVAERKIFRIRFVRVEHDFYNMSEFDHVKRATTGRRSVHITTPNSALQRNNRNPYSANPQTFFTPEQFVRVARLVHRG